MSETLFSPIDWDLSGRKQVKELKGWRSFFCLHLEKPGAPAARCRIYPDINYVQCEKCGKWHYPRSAPSKLGELFRHMVTGK